MDDPELRSRLDDVQEDVKEMRQMLTGMQVADAQARGDLKAVVGKLDNAAVALANAAQSIQIRDMAAKEPVTLGRLSELDRWLLRIAVGVIALGILALGGKELLSKWLGG